MTTEMHKAPSVAHNTGTSGDNATSLARYDLSTSEGGRRYVADFFTRELRRHDFARYITTTLAADFACALAQHLAATGKQQVGESNRTTVDSGALRLALNVLRRAGKDEVAEALESTAVRGQQVGEVQGDALPPLSADEVAAMAPAGLTWDETGAWAMGYEACRKAALAARQPGAQEPVDVEAALAAGDPNWQAQCRPNLRGNESLFFAVRDIAEMRAMLAGEKKPLPGSGLAVVRVNPNAPSVVPYQCAHRLLGDAYQAGEKGGGFCDQAEELFVAMTAHAKRNRMAVVYAAPPAQGIDLGQFREAVVAAREHHEQTWADMHDTGHAKMQEYDRLLALIDKRDEAQGVQS